MANIPAVALTAYARSKDRLQVLRAGYQMDAAKPVELTKLVAIVANHAGFNSPVCPLLLGNWERSR